MIRLQDIADRAGVSKMTVSRALRGALGVDTATRKRIEMIAEELGYSRNALAAAFYAGRSRKGRNVCPRIAYINFHGRDRMQYSVINELFQGAREAVSALGYEMDEVFFDEAHSPEPFLRMLYARGHSGLLIAPAYRRVGMTLDAWSFGQFSAVFLGDSIPSPALGRVTQAYLDQTYNACNQLWQRGYRRIGMILHPEWELRSAHGCSGGYLSFCMQHQPRGMLRLFCSYSQHKREKEEFFKWLEKARPDVVVSATMREYEWMISAGIRIPAETGFFWLDLNLPDCPLSGVRPRGKEMGAIAARLLADDIEHRRLGIPPVPIRTLVKGVFCQGNSIRSIVA